MALIIEISNPISFPIVTIALGFLKNFKSYLLYNIVWMVI